MDLEPEFNNDSIVDTQNNINRLNGPFHHILYVVQNISLNMSDESNQVRDIAKVIEKYRPQLLSEHACKQTAVGYKIKNGKMTDTLGIVIFVRSKPSVQQLIQNNIRPVPHKFEDISTDIIEIPTGFRPRISLAALSDLTEKVAGIAPDDSRYKELMGGEAIIGATEKGSGTLGMIVQKSTGPSDSFYLITNNHVIANEDMEFKPPSASKGDPVIQPGTQGGGHVPRDTIGKLDSWNRPNPSPFSTNYYDFAMAEIISQRVSDIKEYQVKDIGDVVGAAPINPGDIVMKRGRTTLKTTGKVQSVIGKPNVGYHNGATVPYTDQAIIVGFPDIQAKFSDAGDSGSIIVGQEKAPLGYNAKALLFSGGRGSDGIDYTIASPIERIIKDFNLEL